MINSLINQKYFLSQKLQKEIFAIICTKKINTIIIGGPKGLGKRNYVLKLAKFILCNLEFRKEITLDFFEEKKFNFEKLKTTKSFHLFDNNSHPDFFYLNDKEIKLGKTIPIENVRKFKNFFYKTDSISRVKIGIIDTIEDLSINSQNLLLKTIEELPKNSFLFIISNDPTNILETIKSRCAFFYINSLGKSEFNKLGIEVDKVRLNLPKMMENKRKSTGKKAFTTSNNQLRSLPKFSRF